MKKRDVFILVVLIIVVFVFTAWENLIQREKETESEQTRQIERAKLEKRLAHCDLQLDSLSTTVLHIIDSLHTQAAVFESLAKQRVLEVAANQQKPETLAPRAEKVAPPDTLPGIIRTAYESAMSGLPADLTRYERKIAHKEVENTLLAKYGLTQEAFAKMKKGWTSPAKRAGGG